jgi:two-component system, chemotaxis family, CheB/CheR fusion protein
MNTHSCNYDIFAPTYLCMNSFFVVGLGASAGGIQALQTFFKATPASSNMAYVVILHLSPDQDSQLAQVLQHSTTMYVSQVKESVYLEPDHVYVISPDKHLKMEDGHLIVSTNTDIADRRAPVDIFFRSLAESHNGHAIGIILSGSGANGSMGLKRIKELGGAVFVQNPREAEFNEMPRNAIATNMVDEVLNVADIPAKIIAYRDSFGSFSIPEIPKEREENDQQALRNVLTELRMHTGHDFSNYKRPTILRRIERRVHVRNLPDLPAYASFLRQHPEEVYALLRDLLISVTNFFRDQKPFEELETTILPQLLENKTSADHLRIWVAGCATGEEAYSIAMMCMDLTIGMVDMPKIQIFATDIDEAAIAVAREGFYTLNDAADVSQDRLNRYFNKEEAGYRVRQELRETILFAKHNFLKDSPFSRIDLVSCRNVLIYLNRSAQERVFETFHFALKPSGFLLLGSSESVDDASELFGVYSREQHIWQSRQAISRSIVVPENIPRMELLQPPMRVVYQPRPQERVSFGELHQQMVELYAPPSLIVNEEYDIMHLSEHAGRYLKFIGGEPTQNLLRVVREELRAEVRNALYQATQHQVAASALGVKMNIDNATQTLNIHVRPMPEQTEIARKYLLVIFETVAEQPQETTYVVTNDEPASRRLEEEVARLKAQLRVRNEQHEFAAEELKAGNEELQAMNEELRSATEELETSKEELQSINEELSTVNQELKVKIEESNITNNNLRNIINSTDIGTIILDRAFRVVLFTPAARNIFNLIPADQTRPLSDITSRLRTDNLVANAEKVLQSLQGMEQEMETLDGRTYLTRLIPYRTYEDRIQGVVISFVDITDRKKTEGALRSAEEWRRLLIQSAEDFAIFTLNLDRQVISWNIGAQNVFGYHNDEIIGKPGDILFIPEDREKGDPAKEAGRALNEGRAENERWHVRKNGSRFWGSGLVHPLRDDTGAPIGFVKIMRDLTEQKAAEEAVRTSEARLAADLAGMRRLYELHAKLAVETDLYTAMQEIVYTACEFTNTDRGCVQLANSDGTRMEMYACKGYEDDSPFIHHYRYEELKKTTAQQQFVREDWEAVENADAEIMAIIRIEKIRASQSTPIMSRDGESIIGVLSTQFREPHRPTDEELRLMNLLAWTAADFVARHRAEEALRVSNYRFEVAEEASRGFNYDWNFETNTVTRSQSFTHVLGYSSNELAFSMEAWISLIHPDERAAISAVFEINNIYQCKVDHLEAEYRVLHKDGDYRYVHDRALILRNNNGKPTRVIGQAVDITARRQAEEGLRKSEERLRVTVENAVDYAIINTSPDGVIEGWSHGAQRIFGWTETDVLGKSSDIIFTPEDRAAGVPQQEIGTAASEGSSPDERWHIRADGTRFYMSGVMRSIVYANVLHGFVKVARDLTEKKQGEEILRISEERYRTALASAEMAAWDWNVVDDRIIWNDQHSHILGLQPDNKDKNAALFISFVHPDDVEIVDSALRKAVREDSPYRAEFRVVRADNSEIRWMSGFGRAVTRDDEGMATRMVGVMYDITNRKRIEAQKDEFIGIASHELRTPITSIKVYTEILQELFQEQGDTENAELMGKLDKQVDRLTALVYALLDTTLISEGKLQLQRTEFNIDELIVDTTETMQRIAGKHQIVHELTANTNIYADNERIRQVLTNLINNAIKYSPDADRIIVQSSSDERQITICVQDFGIGIDEMTKQHVFDRFFRSGDANDVSGLGLGLYISATIVRQHGGDISVQSEKGKGSVFCFTIPIGK